MRTPAQRARAIQVEKRKKKTKVSYVESELSVQEALDRICSQEGKFNMYNVSSVDGKPEYTKMTSTVGKKEYSSQLQGMCQNLMADFESQIVKFFHSHSKVEDRPKVWSTGILLYKSTLVGAGAGWREREREREREGGKERERDACTHHTPLYTHH